METQVKTQENQRSTLTCFDAGCGTVEAVESMVVDLVDMVQENSQEGSDAEQQNSNSQGHGTQKKRRRVDSHR